MIRVLMLDLGNTLAEGNNVLPHVPEALEVLSRFETASGANLAMALVSDYTMPEPPVTPQKVQAIFEEYVKEIEQLQLKKFFEPVDRHVTLSTHAGVYKPDPIVFKKALQRLRVRAALDACLFITENAEHVAECRKLGMHTLLFGPNGSGEADFSDWSEAPLLIARKVAPENAQNMRLALQLRLTTEFDMELVSVSDGSTKANRIEGRAKKLFPVNVKVRGAQESIEVPFPVNVEISLDKDGRIRDVSSDEPDPEALAESAHYVKTLEANKQISRDKKTQGNETHGLQVDEKGRKVLTRRRFTATPKR